MKIVRVFIKNGLQFHCMGLYGAIVGKAYYAGTVDLAQAVRDAGRQD